MLDSALTTPPKTLEEARTQIDILWGITRKLEAIVSELQSQNEQLTAQVEELNERIGKSSRNSSRPPSSDSISQRAQRRPKKPRSTRNKGAQPGHKKLERELMDDSCVDQTQRYFPHNQCGCGGSIILNNEPVCRHQVFDIPDVSFTLIEHQLFGGQCSGCGKRHNAQLPDTVPSGQMGPNLIALIAHLSGQYHLSIRQIQNYLREHWSLNFSTGAISQAQGKAIHALAEPYRQIGDYVRQQPVAHADETRHFRGTSCRWLWALVTVQACYFLTQASRGKEAADTLLGHFGGYLISDDYVGYNRYPEERRQLCWAHLIRKFIDISCRPGNGGKVGKRLLLIAYVIVRIRHRWESGNISETIYFRRMNRLQCSFNRALEKGSRLRLDGRTKRQCNHMLTRQSMCFTFLKDHRIALTNNSAERAIRPYVIWRKLSFASQSYQGDQFRPLILSIVETAKRLGISVYQFIRIACQQNMIEGETKIRFCFDIPMLPAPSA